MRTRALLMGLGTLAVLWLAGGRPLGAGDKKVVTDDKKANPFELMEKLGKPGENHKLLEPLIGTFHCKVKFYMDPSKPPDESEGTMVRKWIMGGRYVQEEYKGTAAGMNFTGQGLIGYDNFKKKYSVVWIDSMSTAIMTSEGTYDAGSKTFTFTHEGMDPYVGKRTKSRDLVRILDADRHAYEMFKTPEGGKEFKVMEITATRKQK